MSVVEPPPAQPDDSLEGLLRKFFRSQLPHPWPAPRVPSSVSSYQRRPAGERNLMRSRWALAASVALLLLGSFLLPSRFTHDGKSENGLGGPMISDNPRRMHKPDKQRKASENKNHPGFRFEEGQLPDLDDGDLPPLK